MLAAQDVYVSAASWSFVSLCLPILLPVLESAGPVTQVRLWDEGERGVVQWLWSFKFCKMDISGGLCTTKCI